MLKKNISMYIESWFEKKVAKEVRALMGEWVGEKIEKIPVTVYLKEDD